MKRTPWIPFSAKPVRDGLYERRSLPLDIPIYAKWENGQWYVGCKDKTLALNTKSPSTKKWQWRGLTEPSK